MKESKKQNRKQHWQNQYTLPELEQRDLELLSKLEPFHPAIWKNPKSKIENNIGKINTYYLNLSNAILNLSNAILYLSKMFSSPILQAQKRENEQKRKKMNEHTNSISKDFNASSASWSVAAIWSNLRFFEICSILHLRFVANRTWTWLPKRCCTNSLFSFSSSSSSFHEAKMHSFFTSSSSYASSSFGASPSSSLIAKLPQHRQIPCEVHRMSLDQWFWWYEPTCSSCWSETTRYPSCCRMDC